MRDRPDFVILGGQSGDKTVLIASRRIREIEIEETRDIEDRWDYRMIMDSRIDITASVNDYVTIVADSYPEAWAALFDTWSPEPRHNELPGVLALDYQREQREV